MRARELAAALAVVSVLGGCVKYEEEWTFTRHGSGTVRITCEPSADWMKLHRARDWWSTADLFLPPYQALSQACAQAGLKVEKCLYETRGGRPHVSILISFPSLRNAARCSLFSDRVLQWRQGRFSATALNELRAYPAHLAQMRGTLLGKEWFADGSVEIRMVFPGRVVSAEGARRTGRTAVATMSLNDLGQGRNLCMMVTARTVYPWGWFLPLTLFPFGGAAWFAARWWKRGRPQSRQWQPGDVKIETQC